MGNALRRSRWTWTAIVLAALAVYSLGMTHEGLWFDEAYSAAMAKHNVAQIMRLAVSDVHPPLYYLLLRGLRVVLGSSESALRLPSVFGAVALVALGAGPIRRLLGETTSYLYAAVVLFTPAVLIYAHEARMYTLLMFAVTTSAVYGCLAARDNAGRDWVCFGLSSIAAAYLHYYGVIAIFYTHLFLGVCLLARKASALKRLILAGACVFLAYLPWLLVLVKQTQDVRGGFWIPRANLLFVLGSLCVPFTYKDFHPSVPWPAILTVCMAVSITILGVILALMRRARQESPVILLAGGVYLSTMFTAIVVSLILVPVFFPRYMLACLGLVAVSIATGIGLLPSKELRLATLGLFILLNLPVTADVYGQRFNGPMREIARDFRDTVKPGEVIVTADSHAMGPSVYYFPQARHRFYMNETQAQWERMYKVFEPRPACHTCLRQALSSLTSFWLVESNRWQSTREAQTLREELEVWEKVVESAEYSYPYSSLAFTISRYEAKAGKTQ